MRRIIFLFTIGMLLLISTLSHADDEYAAFAKSLPARNFDASLPSQPIEQWMLTVLPKGMTATWGKHATDCGEQTGDPSIDRSRTMPLCVEVELKQQGKTVGYLSLIVGSQKEGKLKERAGLHYGTLKQENRTVSLKKLSDLANIK